MANDFPGRAGVIRFIQAPTTTSTGFY